jgi:hypothetical protein
MVGMGEIRTAHGNLVGKPFGKRPLGRTRTKWEANTETYLRER